MGGPSSSGRSPRRAETLGFPPQSGQNTQQAAGDAELERAKTAARRDRWEPTAQLLARARERRDWARRSFCSDALGSHRAARPDN